MSPPAIERQSVPVTSRDSTRIDALDWTKGALIVFMVVYHAINYSAFRPLAFQYLAFLPPSFILITGFLVGQVYAAKYDLNTWKPYFRLATRGGKLLLVFTVLNLAHCIALRHNVVEGINELALRAGSIFLSGNGRAGIFEVLLPIAYFLLLAPLMLWLRTKAKGSIAAIALVVFLLCAWLGTSGKAIKNLDFLSIGIIGMALGLVPMQKINWLAARWFLILMVDAAYYCLCRFNHSLRESFPGQTFAAVVSVLLIYSCALHLNADTWFKRQIIVLGQYSLLGYLVQIAVLQGVVKILGGRPEHVAGVFAVCALTTMATWFIVKTVHETRRKSRVVDISYKTVFA